MMTAETIREIPLEYNDNSASPSQPESLKPATIAGFRFLNAYGDKMGTQKYIDYKPAQIYRGKKWFVFYSFRNPETKKFVRFRVYEDLNRIKDKDEKEDYAELLRRAINTGLKKGYNPFETDDPLIPVKTWSVVQGLNYFKQKLENRGLRKRTIDAYQSVLRMMYKNFPGQTDIKKLTKHQVEGILLSVKEKNRWSNTTYNNNLTFIRAIFNYLIEADVLETNPAQRIKLLSSSVSRHRYFESEVFEKIKQKSPPDLLLFIMFLYHTGTRPNEARQLRYEHILRERKLLFIPAPISKNKKDGYVPLTNYVLTNFVKKEGLIFGTSVNFFTQKFSELKKELKLSKDYTLYSIKHTRAIHMAQDGADPYQIMQLFRHSGLDVTMNYLRDLGVGITHSEKGIKF